MSRTKRKDGEPCRWKLTDSDPYDDYYETDCGRAFVFIEGSLRDNRIRFCCYCGKPVKDARRER